MARDKNIQEIVMRALKSKLRALKVDRIESEPAVDSEGNEALHITIVISKGASIDTLKDDDVLDALVEIQKNLMDSGEDRLPILEYASLEDIEKHSNAAL